MHNYNPSKSVQFYLYMQEIDPCIASSKSHTGYKMDMITLQIFYFLTR